ncbi:MAG: hypothetical protein ACYDBB_03535 [Armatimonadota bacterium]
MKRLMYLLFAALALGLVPFLFGCSDGELITPPEMVRYDDPAQQTADIVAPILFEFNFRGISIDPEEGDTGSPEGVISMLGFSSYLSDWYPLRTVDRGRGAMTTPAPVMHQAMLGVAKVAKAMLQAGARGTRTPDTINFTDSYGFHWVGTWEGIDSFDNGSIRLHVTGTRDTDVITMVLTGQSSSSESAFSIGGKFTLDVNMEVIDDVTGATFSRESGPTTALSASLTGTLNASSTSGDSPSMSINVGLDANVTAGGRAILDADLGLKLWMNNDTGSLSITGTQLLLAQDGYWILVTENIGTGTSTDITGSIEFRSSDGFTAFINMDGAGEVHNKNGDLVANLTVDLNAGTLTVNFFDPALTDLVYDMSLGIPLII